MQHSYTKLLQPALTCRAQSCTATTCTTLHCTALYCTGHCTTLQCTAHHYTALHCTALYSTTFHCTALHCTALHCTALHFNNTDTNPLSDCKDPDLIIYFYSTDTSACRTLIEVYQSGTNNFFKHQCTLIDHNIFMKRMGSIVVILNHSGHFCLSTFLYFCGFMEFFM